MGIMFWTLYMLGCLIAARHFYREVQELKLKQRETKTCLSLYFEKLDQIYIKGFVLSAFWPLMLIIYFPGVPSLIQIISSYLFFGVYWVFDLFDKTITFIITYKNGFTDGQVSKH